MKQTSVPVCVLLVLLTVVSTQSLHSQQNRIPCINKLQGTLTIGRELLVLPRNANCVDNIFNASLYQFDVPRAEAVRIWMPTSDYANTDFYQAVLFDSYGEKVGAAGNSYSKMLNVYLPAGRYYLLLRYELQPTNRMALPLQSAFGGGGYRWSGCTLGTATNVVRPGMTVSGELTPASCTREEEYSREQLRTDGHILQIDKPARIAITLNTTGFEGFVDLLPFDDSVDVDAGYEQLPNGFRSALQPGRYLLLIQTNQSGAAGRYTVSITSN